jgi:uncharacterized membrane protein
MSIEKPSQAFQYEPRWPIILAILAVIGLLALLPGRIRLFPNWAPYIIGILVLIPIIAVGLTKANPRWLRIERLVTLLFVVFIVISTLTNLANLIQKMVQISTQVGGLQLFASSIAIWVNNVLAFSLLYWQIDRAGPEARINHTGRRPDWLFPQDEAPAEVVLPGWFPTFVDYMYLGFSTATAFSATDVLPMTPRAKLLMMLNSTISLLTLVVVAARAINIIG